MPFATWVRGPLLDLQSCSVLYFTYSVTTQAFDTTCPGVPAPWWAVWSVDRPVWRAFFSLRTPLSLFTTSFQLRAHQWTHPCSFYAPPCPSERTRARCVGSSVSGRKGSLGRGWLSLVVSQRTLQELGLHSHTPGDVPRRRVGSFVFSARRSWMDCLQLDPGQAAGQGRCLFSNGLVC